MNRQTLAVALLMLAGCRTATAPPVEQPRQAAHRLAREEQPPAVRALRIERRSTNVAFALYLQPGAFAERIPFDPLPDSLQSWTFRLKLWELGEPWRSFELAPQSPAVIALLGSVPPDYAPTLVPLAVRPGLVSFAVPESLLSAAPFRYKLLVSRCTVRDGERDWEPVQELEGFEAAPIL